MQHPPKQTLKICCVAGQGLVRVGRLGVLQGGGLPAEWMTVAKRRPLTVTTDRGGRWGGALVNHEGPVGELHTQGSFLQQCRGVAHMTERACHEDKVTEVSV